MNDPLLYVRAVHYAATILVAGTIFFVVAIAEPAFRAAAGAAELRLAVRRRIAWIAWLSLAAALVSGAAWFLLVAESMSGQPLNEVLSQGVLWTVALQTDFGRDWLLRFALVCVLAGLFVPFLAARRLSSAWLDAAVVIAAAVLAGTLVWAGHGSDGEGAAAIVHPIADFLHLDAASAWVGMLVPLGVLLAAVEPDQASLALARTAIVRFSSFGMVIVATLLVTGSINTWYLAGSIPALADTPYGHLLLIKISLFLVMVAIAAVNRLRLTPRLARDLQAGAAAAALRQLRRNAALEAAIGAVVIAIVAVLGTLPPGNHPHHQMTAATARADAALRHVDCEQDMAEIRSEPGRVATARARAITGQRNR